MLAFSIIISASQYVGNPIDCIHTNDIPEVKVSTDKGRPVISLPTFVICHCKNSISVVKYLAYQSDRYIVMSPLLLVYWELA